LLNRKAWLWCAAALLYGCAGKGDIVALDLHARPPADRPSASRPAAEPPLKVVIFPFDDRRPEPGWLGNRTHLWGGQTHFDVAGGKPGEVVATTLAEYLRERGWEVTRAGAPSSGPAKPDVSLNGQVLDLAANAKSRFGSTKMMIRLKLAVLATNAADGSTAHLSVNGARTESEMWFEPENLTALIDELLYDSFERLMADTKVEGRTLQVR
jgi:Holliday junction resolvase